VFWSTSIKGPWQGGTNIAPESEKTYGSQNTFELTINGTQQTTHIYMGDAWDSKGGTGSLYVWAPLRVDTTYVFVFFLCRHEFKADLRDKRTAKKHG